MPCAMHALYVRRLSHAPEW